MGNGYLIAFVVVMAISIGILRYRNRDALQQAERNARFPGTRTQPRKGGDDAQTAQQMTMDIHARETASLAQGQAHGQHTHSDTERNL